MYEITLLQVVVINLISWCTLSVWPVVFLKVETLLDHNTDIADVMVELDEGKLIDREEVPSG